MGLFNWGKKDEPEPEDHGVTDEGSAPAEAPAVDEAPAPDEADIEALEDERVHALPHQTIPMGEKVLIHTHGLCPPTEAPTFFDSILGQCEGMADLDTHTMRIAVRLGIGQPAIQETIWDHLVELHDRGFLVSEGELLERVRSAQGREPGEISTLAISTCDRPDLMAECVRAFDESRREHGRDYDLLVVDDSASQETRERAREMLATAAEDRAVWYAGLEEKQAFVTALKKAGGDRFAASSVDFLLANPHGCDVTTGANRNAALLHTVGELLLSADDDTKPRIARIPDHHVGLRLTRRHDPTEFHFFESRDQLRDAVEFEKLDVAGLHAQLLGRSAAECVAGTELEELDWEAMGTACLEALLRDTGHVALTCTGIAGDSGMATTAYYLYPRPGDSFRRLLDSFDYQELRLTRDVVRGVEVATLGSGAHFMTPLVGIDNREILPPFFPVQRNQDGILARTLRRVAPHGLIGYLPWAVEHVPPTDRTPSEEDLFRHAGSIRASDVILALLATGPSGTRGFDTEASLDVLGRHYQDVGSLPPADFEQHLKESLWQYVGGEASRLEIQLSQVEDAPDQWYEDIERLVSSAQELMMSDDIVAPTDLTNGRTRDEVLELVRALVADWGQLLRDWPAIRETCREMRRDGVRLGRALEPAGS